MEAFLKEGVEDAPELAAGVSEKLKLASAANDFAPSTRSVHTLAKEARALADAAGLNGIELTRFATWLFDAYSAEAAALFEKAVPLQMTVPSQITSQAKTTPVRTPDEEAYGRAFDRAEARGGDYERGVRFQSARAPFSPFVPPEDHGSPMDKADLDTPTSEQMAADCAAQGLKGTQLIQLTFTLHTARKPPPEHEELRYGVDPANMPKLYKTYKTASGTMLWDLVNSDKTTMVALRDHMHRAQQQARSMDSGIASRIGDHWGEMQQFFGDSVKLIRAYYRKFLQLYAGRGLPVLVDKEIVMLILCCEMQTESAGGDDTKRLTELVEKQTKTVDTLRDQVSDLKQAVGSFKEEVKQLKEKMNKQGSENKGFCKWCKEHSKNPVGHTEADCKFKKAAKEAGED